MNPNNILFKPSTLGGIGLTVLIFAVVIVCSYTADNFIFIYKFEGLLLGSSFVFLLLGLSLIFFSKNLHFNFTPADIIVFLWSAYILIQPFVIDATVERKKTEILLVGFGLFFSSRLFSSFEKKKYSIVVLHGIILTSIIESFIALGQYYGLFPPLDRAFQVTGTFKNPAPAALFLGTSSVCSIALLLFLRRNTFKTLRYLSWVNVILSAIVLPLTENRATWVGLAIAFAYLLQTRYRFLTKILNAAKQNSLRKFAVGLIAFIVIASLIVGLYSYKSISADARLLVWKITSNKITEKPILGYGTGSFKILYDKWQVEYFLQQPLELEKQLYSGKTASYYAGFVKMPYNEFLELLAEQGAVGLCMFLLIVALLIRSLLANPLDVTKAIFGSAIVFLLTASLVSYPLYSLPTFLLFFTSAGIVNSGSLRNLPLSKKNRYRFVGAIACILAVGVIVNSVADLRIYLNYAKLKQLKEFSGRSSITKYQNLYPKLKDDPEFLIDLSIAQINGGQKAQALQNLKIASNLDNDPRIFMMSGDILKEMKSYDDAEKMYQTAHLIIPSRIYPKYLLAKLYDEMGEKQKAIEIADKILLTEVKGNSNLYPTIFAEMNQLIQSYHLPIK